MPSTKQFLGLLKLFILIEDALVPTTTWNGRCASHWKFVGRVKEQQKRVGSGRVPQYAVQLRHGLDGVEKFVSTPELQSETSIGSDPIASRPGLGD